jgi:extradiol dioxygenase family protein
MAQSAQSPTPPGGSFFQLGYVARDLKQALAIFAERYGVRRFQHYMASPDFDVALAYRGETMIEIIAPHKAGDPLYGDARAQGELVLHHLGYLVNAEEWSALPDRLAALEVPITKRSPDGSPVGFIYADTRKDLGHFTEYVHLPPDTTAFAQVPRN